MRRRRSVNSVRSTADHDSSLRDRSTSLRKAVCAASQHRHGLPGSWRAGGALGGARVAVVGRRWTGVDRLTHPDVAGGVLGPVGLFLWVDHLVQSVRLVDHGLPPSPDRIHPLRTRGRAKAKWTLLRTSRPRPPHVRGTPRPPRERARRGGRRDVGLLGRGGYGADGRGPRRRRLPRVRRATQLPTGPRHRSRLRPWIRRHHPPGWIGEFVPVWSHRGGPVRSWTKRGRVA